MGGPRINYPEQPTYGEGLADALEAQINLLTGTGQFAPDKIGVQGGLMGTIPLEREARLAYAQIEPELTAATLGLQVAGPEGRYVSGQQYVDETGLTYEKDDLKQILSEDDQAEYYLTLRPDLQKVFDADGIGQGDKERGAIYKIKKQGGTAKDFANWHRKTALTGHYGATEQQRANKVPELGSYYDPASVQEYQAGSGVITEEDVYEYAPSGEGAFVGTKQGGMIDILGGGTKVVQYDPVTGDQSIGQAGFDPTTGEFQGLIPMQAQAQAYTDDIRAAAAARRGAKLAEGITGAIREQGNIGALVNQISDIRGAGDIAAAPIRNEALRQGFELLGRGLSDREREQIEQASRTAGVQAGRVRDIGRIQSEVGELVEQDRMRQMQNLQAASGILGQEMGMQRQDFGELLQQLGAEQATAADPSTWAGAQTMAPSAQGLLGAGAGMAQQAGPQLINPEAGLGYISQRAANQATMAAGQAAGRGSMMSGLLQGLGTIGGAVLGGPVGAAIGGSLGSSAGQATGR